MRNLGIGAATFAFVAMTALVPSTAFAQAAHEHEPAPPAKGDDKPAMMCQKMMDAASARAASLHSLVHQMKTSTGDARLEIMAELLTRLVEEPKAPEPAAKPAPEHGKKCESMKKPDGAAR